MTEEKILEVKVAKRRGRPPKEMTSREKILKHCEVVKERNHAGNVLIFGKHRYRMNRLLADLTDAECDRVFENIERIGLDTRTKQAEKSVASRRIAVASVEPRPCECGCRAITRRGSRFLPGHDAKLKSALRKAGTPEAEKELASRGW